MCPHAVANLHTAGGQNPIMLGTLPTEPYPRQESVSVALFVQGVEDLPPPTPHPSLTCKTGSPQGVLCLRTII